jgi:hypothetical protein
MVGEVANGAARSGGGAVGSAILLLMRHVNFGVQEINSSPFAMKDYLPGNCRHPIHRRTIQECIRIAVDSIL